MNITNDREVKIFRFDEKDKTTNEIIKTKYTVGIHRKLENGEYESGFFPIQFNKGIEVEDKSKITIKKAWLSFYNWEMQGKKGTTFFIKCSEFDKAEQENERTDLGKAIDKQYEDFGNSVELTDEDIDSELAF